jgi:hypothetical protein
MKDTGMAAHWAVHACSVGDPGVESLHVLLCFCGGGCKSLNGWTVWQRR